MSDIARQFHNSVPPHWRPSHYFSHVDPTVPKRMGAIIACPNGHERALRPDEIAPDGSAKTACDRCDWRDDDARLTGWKGATT